MSPDTRDELSRLETRIDELGRSLDITDHTVEDLADKVKSAGITEARLDAADQEKGTGLRDLLDRLDQMDRHMNSIDKALGDHWVRIVALEGKKVPQVETVDLTMPEAPDAALGLRKALMGETIKQHEVADLKRQIEELVIQRSEKSKMIEAQHDAIRKLQDRISELIGVTEKKKGFTIEVVRVHQCRNGHRWVDVVTFDNTNSPEKVSACSVCGSDERCQTPFLLRYPAGGLAEIKGVGDLHKPEYFLL